jgi:16S rRNA (guanine527-N7)-methyltransferase
VNLADKLAGGIAALGLALDQSQQVTLLAYLALLAKWNRVYNLTAVREPERMLTLHVLDSLAVLPVLDGLPGAARVLDVGSGGGLPGIPLAIARPEWRVTLLDANQKKASFLRQASTELGLNAQVVQDRIDAFPARGSFDLVISRAFADLNDFLRAALPFAAPRGKVAAMKGVHPYEELAQLAPETPRDPIIERLKVPGLDAERHLIVFTSRP